MLILNSSSKNPVSTSKNVIKHTMLILNNLTFLDQDFIVKL